VYELVRARHATVRGLSALGLRSEDLGAPVRVAAKRAGVAPERLLAALGWEAGSQPVAPR
uniref:hypothetical protein n=1 Tax=Tepidiforma sp. TaxID=2682230 RepID=UPI002ADE887D